MLATVPAAAAGGRAGVGDPYFPEDGNSGYDVANYDVSISYDPAHPDRLAGDTTITARATDDLDRFNLDLTGFEVTSVTVNGRPARSVVREGAHELVITPAARLAEGARFAVRVRYSGKPVGEGWHTLADGGAYVSGEPHAATAWYPANDHPSDKATFSLTATVPAGWTVIGNGLPGPTTDDGGRRTFRWHEDRPMATYLSTVAMDKFTVHTAKTADGIPVITAYSPGSRIDPAAEVQQTEILDFLASRFGAYPFSSAGAIVVEGGTGEGPLALETQSRPTYASGSLFDLAMVHELTHQWFGDSVSFSDWRDGCIAECFAQYANMLWQEREGADIDQFFYRDTVQENQNDPDFWRVPLYDPGPGRQLDGALYDKGSLMLHALRRTVGDDKFFRTLKRWQRTHRYGNASWPQFEALAAETSGQDLSGFFTAWAHGTTIPPSKYLYPGTLGSPPATR